MYGDTGEYFYFSEQDFTDMVGIEDWESEIFDVIQKGSHNWTGKVKVWKAKFHNSGAHGRRDPKGSSNGSKPGQWAAGDTIELVNCS